jgi:predicted PurR-regulated permease PerM
MLGLDGRAARAAWTVILVLLAIVGVYLIRRTLLVFALAVLLAYLLAPLTRLADRVAPRRLPRAVTLALIYAALIAAAVLIGSSVASRVYSEAVELARKVPDWVKSQDVASRLPIPAWLEPWKVKLIEAARQQLEASAREAVPILGRAGAQVLGVLGNVGFAILVPILSFFFLKDGAAMRKQLLDQLAQSPHRAFVDDVLSDVHVLLGQFMRALVVLSLATLAFYGLFFWLIGLPYAALLAGLAAVLEFIPVLGPLTAAIAIVLVAMFSGHLSLVLWILAFLGGYRLFQDYVLQPYLMSAGVALHPLWIIFGVLAGEQIGGVAGMFLSIPVLATVRVVVVRVQKARDRAGLGFVTG